MTTMPANAEFWNDIAEKYAAQPVKDADAFERKKRITRGLLEADHRVLEIGCGTGSLSVEMAPRAREIHAMDVSEEMVRIARDKAKKNGVDNLTFHVGTLEGAPFEPGSFDHAWAYSILHLLEDLPGSLRRLHDLLAPGGHLISSTVCLRESWVPYPALIRVMRWFGKAPRFVANIDRPTLERAVRDAGFVEVQVHDIRSDAAVVFLTARKPR